MTPERWQTIKSLLDDSAGMKADQWPAWLEKTCGHDPALRQEVEAYLVGEDELDAFIADSPAETLLTAIDRADSDEGRLIGPYRLDHLLGRGGMGAVYQAHRETHQEQMVALKLVRFGFETPSILRRFQNERQILARLKHPNIARLLDGGTSDDGRPFFVMELVEGERIDLYCDERRLTIHQRLELILKVCDALQLAHCNRVIHRDLKPSNILVTPDGVPKLLDFGISKIIESDREHSLFTTAAGEGPMTLSYASPEQVFDQPVTIVSDLYSLGVVLYELLTGRLPHGLDSINPALVAQAIQQRTPSAPSSQVYAAMATTRATTEQALRGELRGDLDAIVLQALSKDPAHRHASADQLAADLQRCLENRPARKSPGHSE